MNFHSNPSARTISDFYQKTYPEKSTRQLLDYIKKDLERAMGGNDAGSENAKRHLKQWKKLSKEIQDALNDPQASSSNASSSNASSSTTINNDIKTMTVQGHFVQGHVYESAKRTHDDSLPLPTKPSKVQKSDQYHDRSSQEDYDDFQLASDTGEDKEYATLFEEWDWFLFESTEADDVSQYSPEKHGIVVCGDSIASRPGMPESYAKMKQFLQKDAMERSTFKEVFSEQLCYVNNVMDQTSAPKMLQAVRRIPDRIHEQEEEKFYFLADLFSIIVRDIFLCKPDLESETALNVAAIFPAAKIATVDYHATAKDLEFSPGEIFLQSMAKQLKKIDNCRGEANGYKADGLIRINTIRNMEVVLFETSGGVKGGSKRKQTFDFHKGMFGLVSMLKALADTFPYASYERMSAIKIYFVHTCGSEVRLWSFAVGEPGQFRMLRVDKCYIPKDIDEQAETLGYLRFFWDLRTRVKETVGAIKELEASNAMNQRKYRYEQLPDELNLSIKINPVIVKISEKTHSSCFDIEDNPRSSPPLPSFY